MYFIYGTTMSKLIINEHPLMVLPSLATAIGLNESIILQQVHYWLDPRTNKNIKNGVTWVYNTYHQWSKQFPFWSEVTIGRIIRSLENKGLLKSSYFSPRSLKKEKWYTIDYAVLDNLSTSLNNDSNSSSQDTTSTKKELEPSSLEQEQTYHLKSSHKTTSDTASDQNDMPSDQIDTTIVSKRHDHRIKLIRPSYQIDTTYNITETTTKTTTDLSISISGKDVENQDFKVEREMIEIWNKVVKKGESPSRPTESRLIKLQNILKILFNNDMNQWQNYCQRITQSKFLMGEVNSFKASLDWCLKSEVMQKIQEGEYGVGNRVSSVVNVESEIVELEEDVSNPLWQEAKKHISAKLGIATFKSWITKLDFLEEADGVIYLKAASRFVKDYIETHYQNSIISAWKQINPQIREVSISFA
jgi:hypothetical protein